MTTLLPLILTVTLASRETTSLSIMSIPMGLLAMVAPSSCAVPEPSLSDRSLDGVSGTLFEADEMDFEEGDEALLIHERHLLVEPDSVRVGDDLERTLNLNEPFEVTFEGDYAGMGAAQLGGDELPEWLNLEIKTDSVFKADTFLSGPIIQKDRFIYVGHRLGFHMLEKDPSQKVRQVATYSSNEMLDNTWSKLAIGHNKAFLVISSFPDFVDHLEIVDIHNMQRVYSHLLNHSDIIDIQATDHLLLLLSPIDLKVYTIALLPELTLLARYSTDSFFENMVISPDQGTLYSVTIDGIQTLNLRSFRQAVVFNETYPELMTSSFKAPWQARAITIGENNILVSVSREGVCIFSLQNASYPTQEWALAMPITDYYQPPLLFKQLLLIKKNSDEFSLWDMREPYKPKGIGKISLGNDHELFSMLAVQGEVWGTQGDALQRLDFSHGVLKGTPRHRDDIDAIAGSEMTVIVTGAEDTGNFPVSTLKFGFDDIMLQSSFLPKEQRLFPGEVRILRLNT